MATHDINKLKLPNNDICNLRDATSAGKKVEGVTFTNADGTTVTAGTGAEQFNVYTTNKQTAGTTNIPSGNNSHAEGAGTIAYGGTAHSEGNQTVAKGYASHAEGSESQAKEDCSHAEGFRTQAEAESSHSEGYITTASGGYSHAEGSQTVASNTSSHAEGGNTTASGGYSHAEGLRSVASGSSSHAEGGSTSASGDGSHAEGAGTSASGYYSHAEGRGTTTSRKSQHVEGEYNITDTAGSGVSFRGKFAHIIGNGTGSDNRSNAYAIDWDGKIYQPSDPNADANGVYLSSKADKATTLDGYGINDAKFTTSTGEIQLGSNTLVPVRTIQINGTTQTNTKGTVNIPAASTGGYGVTILSDSVNSTLDTQAATANAVKTAYDEGVTALNYSANTGVKNLFNFNAWKCVSVNPTQGYQTHTDDVKDADITDNVDASNGSITLNVLSGQSSCFTAYGISGTYTYPKDALVEVTAGKLYTFSFNVDSISSGAEGQGLVFKNGQTAGSDVIGNTGKFSTTGTKSVNFTAPSGCKFVTIRFDLYGASSSITYSNIIIRENIVNNTFGKYTPTNRQLYDTESDHFDYISSVGVKNIMSPELTEQSLNGLTFTVNGDESITVSGTKTNQNQASTVCLYVRGTNFDTLFNGLYKFSAITDSNYNLSTANYQVYLTRSGSGVVEYDTGCGFILPDSSYTNWNIVFSIPAGKNLSAPITIYPMIRHKDIINSEYQQHAMTNLELTGPTRYVSNNMKNAFWPTFNSNASYWGLSIINNYDGSITLNGTVSRSVQEGTYAINFILQEIKPPEGYYVLSCDQLNTAGYAVIGDNAGMDSSQNNAVYFDGNTTTQIRLYLVNGFSATNLVIKPMLCRKEYWNIDNEFKDRNLTLGTTSGSLIDIIDSDINKNLFVGGIGSLTGATGVTITDTGNGTYKLVKTSTTSTYLIPYWRVYLEPGTYVLTGCPRTGAGTNYDPDLFRLDLRDNSGNQLGGTEGMNTSDVHPGEIKITTAGWYRVTIRVGATWTTNGVTIMPMLCRKEYWNATPKYKLQTGYTKPTPGTNISIESGGYYKNGNICIVNMRFRATSSISAGTTIFSGLPYPITDYNTTGQTSNTVGCFTCISNLSSGTSTHKKTVLIVDATNGFIRTLEAIDPSQMTLISGTYLCY